MKVPETKTNHNYSVFADSAWDVRYTYVELDQWEIQLPRLLFSLLLQSVYKLVHDLNSRRMVVTVFLHCSPSWWRKEIGGIWVIVVISGVVLDKSCQIREWRAAITGSESRGSWKIKETWSHIAWKCNIPLSWEGYKSKCWGNLKDFKRFAWKILIITLLRVFYNCQVILKKIVHVLKLLVIEETRLHWTSSIWRRVIFDPNFFLVYHRGLEVSCTRKIIGRWFPLR